MLTFTVRCPRTGDPIQVDGQDVLLFPDGLVGCPSWQRFVLLDENEDDPIKFLQSLDDPNICFLATDPHHVDPGYRIRPAEADLEVLEIEDLDQAVLMCTLRIWENEEKITANLLGPLVINPRTRQGRQIVLADSPYSAQHPVVLEVMAEQIA